VQHSISGLIQNKYSHSSTPRLEVKKCRNQGYQTTCTLSRNYTHWNCTHHCSTIHMILELFTLSWYKYIYIW